ncbi:MAG: hypothetical protein GY716_14215, partial [bacterium]|nr:hypothetical protein [bacterium]
MRFSRLPLNDAWRAARHAKGLVPFLLIALIAALVLWNVACSTAQGSGGEAPRLEIPSSGFVELDGSVATFPLQSIPLEAGSENGTFRTTAPIAFPVVDAGRTGPVVLRQLGAAQGRYTSDGRISLEIMLRVSTADGKSTDLPLTLSSSAGIDRDPATGTFRLGWHGRLAEADATSPGASVSIQLDGIVLPADSDDDGIEDFADRCPYGVAPDGERVGDFAPSCGGAAESRGGADPNVWQILEGQALVLAIERPVPPQSIVVGAGPTPGLPAEDWQLLQDVTLPRLPIDLFDYVDLNPNGAAIGGSYGGPMTLTLPILLVDSDGDDLQLFVEMTTGRPQGSDGGVQVCPTVQQTNEHWVCQGSPRDANGEFTLVGIEEIPPGSGTLVDGSALRLRLRGILDPTNEDIDGDGIPAHVDNCPDTSNAGQEDGNGDGVGDVCAFVGGASSSFLRVEPAGSSVLVLGASGAWDDQSVPAFAAAPPDDWRTGALLTFPEVRLDLFDTLYVEQIGQAVGTHDPGSGEMTLAVPIEMSDSDDDEWQTVLHLTTGATSGNQNGIAICTIPPAIGDPSVCQGTPRNAAGDLRMVSLLEVPVTTQLLVAGDTYRVEVLLSLPAADTDADGIEDFDDNCPTLANSDQADADQDGRGDLCPCTDDDGDTFCDDQDCDDADATVNPGAPETCDGVDNDCDGLVDEDGPNEQIWYADFDLDGFGDAGETVQACDPPPGYVADDTDCNDASAAVNPAADEICGDTFDNDCDGVADDTAPDAPLWYADGDLDGYGDPGDSLQACSQPTGYVANDEDCDDDGATGGAINPDAAEVCGDGVDNDCDGNTDDTGPDAPPWYRDDDGDGFGDAGDSIIACERPAGYVSDGSDCDDQIATCAANCTIDVDVDGTPDCADSCLDVDDDGYGIAGGAGNTCLGDDCNDNPFAGGKEINPGAVELCGDGVDNDCDDVIDEDAPDLPTWYVDGDGDGFGDAADSLAACAQPAGYVDDSGDCDDTNAAINPDAEETCDGVDNDCDGTVDDDAVEITVWYRDADGDGYGDDTDTVTDCDGPAGYVEQAGDCDDSAAAVNPGATEVCGDAVDNNCDGTVDEDAPDLPTWYADTDGDGYGDAEVSTSACQLPSGYVADGTDCDDSSAAVNPGAIETCGDGVDNDCDGTIDDDAPDSPTWYRDVDGDGFGDPGDSTIACSQPAGHVADGTDCDDTSAAVNPAAAEVCGDGVDNDCDGTTDIGGSGELTWYADADGDGFGDAAVTLVACAQPAGHVADSTDCDDSSSAVNPAAAEVCGDGIDNNCDGNVDDSDPSAPVWYEDTDGDGFGDPGSTTIACELPSGYVADGTDCDDTSAAVNPDAIEVCGDATDNDCDGTVDDDAPDAPLWYADTDGDGFGDVGNTVQACNLPAGFTGDATDCDDTSAAINPDAIEICGDDVDNDCDGVVDSDAPDLPTWYLDDDEDGYGNPDAFFDFCGQPAGFVMDNTDCDDEDAAVNPGAEEVCGDGVDNDCDGATDEDGVGATTFFLDFDGDGFGDPNSTTIACELPSGYVADATDCDDAEVGVNPSATEVCGDATDNDCDGTVDDDAPDAATWYRDIDNDGYGDAGGATVACSQPSGYVPDDTDCDDLRETVNPGAPEVCGDELDNDCDGGVDNGGVGSVFWYHDADGDGFGDPADSQIACSQPEGYVTDSSDCDDSEATCNTNCIQDFDLDGTIDCLDSCIDADDDGYGSPGGVGDTCLGPDCNDNPFSGGELVNPGVPEQCADGVDNNCDGQVDEDGPGAPTWYRDADGDAFGDPNDSTSACTQPAGYLADSSDCDDGNAANNPAAEELCGDGVDNDCDGTIDDDAPLLSTWYADTDGDGFGDASSSLEACAQPAGYVSDASDCDDGSALVNPDAVEVCGDGVDNDCDGVVDEDALELPTWYRDADGDGYGDAGTTTTACAQPAGHVADDADCDDSSAAVNPAAAEVCGDGIDNDCDGATDDDGVGASTWYRDADGDGYGDAGDATTACAQPAGYVSDDADCDDGATAVNPGAAEACGDGIDNDCDGATDDDGVGAGTWYRDADGDGYGDAGTPTRAWAEPAVDVADGAVCDDTTAAVNPAAAEVCGDGIDND